MDYVGIEIRQNQHKQNVQYNITSLVYTDNAFSCSRSVFVATLANLWQICVCVNTQQSLHFKKTSSTKCIKILWSLLTCWLNNLIRIYESTIQRDKRPRDHLPWDRDQHFIRPTPRPKMLSRDHASLETLTFQTIYYVIVHAVFYTDL